MKKDDTVFLRHILDAIARVEMYSQDVSYKQFMQTPLIQDGIIRNLEIIGEASRNMSGELRAQHPAVPWNRIIGLRNRITHGYFNIILDIVWEIVQNDVPTLKRDVTRILEEFGR